MRAVVTTLAVVAAFAVGVYVGIRYEREPGPLPAGGVWLTKGPAGQAGADEQQWSNCGVAVRPDLSDELVICRADGRYQCYSPGDSWTRKRGRSWNGTLAVPAPVTSWLRSA